MTEGWTVTSLYAWWTFSLILFNKMQNSCERYLISREVLYLQIRNNVGIGTVTLPTLSWHEPIWSSENQWNDSHLGMGGLVHLTIWFTSFLQSLVTKLFLANETQATSCDCRFATWVPTHCTKNCTNMTKCCMQTVISPRLSVFIGDTHCINQPLNPPFLHDVAVYNIIFPYRLN